MESLKPKSMLGRLTILQAINHPSLERMRAQKGKKEVALSFEDSLALAFALYAPSAAVVDAAYFDEQGERKHSPRKWLAAVHAWMEEVGDEKLAELFKKLGEADSAE